MNRDPHMAAYPVKQIFERTRDFVRTRSMNPLQGEILDFALATPQLEELQAEPPPVRTENSI